MARRRRRGSRKRGPKGSASAESADAEQGANRNRYAHLNRPDAVLDFHDQGSLSRQAIKARTIAFIETARAAGHKRLRIVTGKGLHSRGKPLARPQVLRTLRALESEGLVRGFHEETLAGGGEGALRIDL